MKLWIFVFMVQKWQFLTCEVVSAEHINIFKVLNCFERFSSTYVGVGLNVFLVAFRVANYRGLTRGAKKGYILKINHSTLKMHFMSLICLWNPTASYTVIQLYEHYFLLHFSFCFNFQCGTLLENCQVKRKFIMWLQPKTAFLTDTFCKKMNIVFWYFCLFCFFTFE